MREYETIAVLKPDVNEEYVSGLIKKVDKVISGKPGEILKKDDWGVKKLAYPIEKQKKARYIIWTYKNLPTIVTEVEDKLRFEENILRFLTVVREKPAKVKSKDRVRNHPKKKEAMEDGDDDRKMKRRDEIIQVDYKDPTTLVRFITERGKIVPRRNTGASATEQYRVVAAIKRARQLALLSYTEGFYYSPEEPQQRSQS